MPEIIKYLLILTSIVSTTSFAQPADLLKRAETDPRAQYKIGEMFYDGDGVDRDYEKSISWLLKAAESNNGDAFALLGKAHENGNGVQKDEKLAVDYYKKSIQQGSNQGRINYALFLIKDKKASSKNIELAHSFLKQAADNNSPAGMYELGRFYKNGFVKSDVHPLDLYEKAADRGYKDAIIDIHTSRISNPTTPTMAQLSAEVLENYRGDLIVDATLAYYYGTQAKNKQIELAKDILKPHLESNHRLVYITMALINLEDINMPEAIHYMKLANGFGDKVFDVEKYERNYQAKLKKAEQERAELQREQKFINIVVAAARESNSAHNEMQLGGIKNKRDKELCELIKDRKVNNWIGYIADLSANSDGYGVLSITIANNVILRTRNNSFSDIGSKTLIHPDSELFKTASQMLHGQKVKFSGTFLPGEKRLECLREASLTLGGTLSEPEFIFRFNSIEPIFDTPSKPQ